MQRPQETVRGLPVWLCLFQLRNLAGDTSNISEKEIFSVRDYKPDFKGSEDFCALAAEGALHTG